MQNPTQKHGTIVLLLFTLLLAACGGSPPAQTPTEAAPATEMPVEDPTATAEIASTEIPAPEANLTGGCVENYAEGIDYFPEKATITYAEGLEITYFDNYKIVSVLAPWPGATEAFEYALVQCGTPAPADFDGDAVIEVPITSIVPMSTTYLTYIETLGQIDSITGLDSFAYVNNPAIREKIDAGELVEVAPGFQLNVEVALELNPDLIMAFSAGVPEYDNHPALIEAGLPTVVNADWVEGTPLARAEWVKFIALFYNLEAAGEAAFESIASQYNQAATLAQSVEERPTVLVNDVFNDVWNVPGGSSYMAQLLNDSGADYLWSDDDSTGSLFLDFEAVFDHAQNADIWINVGPASLDDLAAIDERYTEFGAFQSGQVYAHNKRQTEYGNDYFESGSAQPHIVLLDMIKIFHPDLLPDHEFVYYQQLQ